jgi:hypothetical protein
MSCVEPGLRGLQPRTRRANQPMSISIPTLFVQPSNEKYCCFVFSEVMIYSPRSAADERGVRVVTNVARNAVDAIVLTDERRRLRTAKSCGPGAPRSGAKFSRSQSASQERRWQTEWFTEESAYKP